MKKILLSTAAMALTLLPGAAFAQDARWQQCQVDAERVYARCMGTHFSSSECTYQARQAFWLCYYI